MSKIDILSKVIEKVPAVGRATFKIQKASPEILLVGGIAAIGVGTFLACRATLKLESILDEAGEQKDRVVEAIETYDEDSYSEADAKSDILKINAKGGAQIVKAYLPAVATIGVGIACVVGGHHIQKERIVALGAAYKVIETGFGEYRKRVVDVLGEDKDREFRFGPKIEKIETTEVQKNGKEKVVEKKVKTVEIGPSDYAIYFDETCRQWRRNVDHNLDFLRSTQNFMNEKLRLNGHVFLNEVYDALGAKRTAEGQVVGWIYEGNGDSYIDFGITEDYYNGRFGHDYVNGVENSLLLDFNVDGVIINSEFEKHAN